MINIIVSHVKNILKFKHFICVKYNYQLPFGNVVALSINNHGPIKFYGLKECEIRYLIYEKICTFKIDS